MIYHWHISVNVGRKNPPRKVSCSSVQPDPAADRQSQSQRAARLMDLLGLSEDELCQALAVDPLSLLSGQIEHRAELGILLALLDEATETASPALLRRWVRTQGPHGRP